jgi:hypothetical protein
VKITNNTNKIENKDKIERKHRIKRRIINPDR